MIRSMFIKMIYIIAVILFATKAFGQNVSEREAAIENAIKSEKLRQEKILKDIQHHHDDVSASDAHISSNKYPMFEYLSNKEPILNNGEEGMYIALSAKVVNVDSGVSAEARRLLAELGQLTNQELIDRGIKKSTESDENAFWFMYEFDKPEESSFQFNFFEGESYEHVKIQTLSGMHSASKGAEDSNELYIGFEVTSHSHNNLWHSRPSMVRASMKFIDDKVIRFVLEDSYQAFIAKKQADSLLMHYLLSNPKIKRGIDTVPVNSPPDKPRSNAEVKKSPIMLAP